VSGSVWVVILAGGFVDATTTPPTVSSSVSLIGTITG
jgi:hypothetical protein